jgi:hypothetical protein
MLEDRMQSWLCHKRVRAARIIGLDGLEPDGSRALTVQLADGAAARLQAPSEVFTRHKPRLGDYLVIEHDGYMRVCAKARFEAGFAPVSETPPLAATG